MITIEVGNVKSRITGLTDFQTEFLYDKLSYEDKKTIFLKLRNEKLMGLDLRKRLFQPKRGIFFTGLLNRVIDLLNGVPVKIIDNRTQADKINYFKLKVPFPKNRYYQDEALNIIKTNNSSTIEICTGGGKTQVLLSAIQERGVNNLVIVPTLNLLDQFVASAEYHFGDKVVGTHKDKVQKPITVANVQGLQKKDQAFFDFYQQVIIDELHHQASDSYYDLNKINWNHIPYKISTSATPFRNDNADMRLEAVSGPVLFSYKAKQCVKDGYIVAPHFVIYEIKNFGVPSNGWHNDYEKYLVNHKYRNDKIIGVTNKFLNTTNKNILILANRIEHVEKLHSRIPDSVMVTGETKDNDKTFNNYRMGNIRCMIATSQVVGEGIDIPNIDVLILAGGYESEIQINQAIGRVVRLDLERGKKFGIVIDFYDQGTPILERHSESRINTYKETYGKEYVRIIKG